MPDRRFRWLALGVGAVAATILVATRAPSSDEAPASLAGEPTPTASSVAAAAPHERSGDPLSREAFPGELTTGVPPGVTLEDVGRISVEEDGAVLDGLSIRGTVFVRANDVTIRRSRIVTDGDRLGIRIDPDHSGLLIEDSEVYGSDGACQMGIAATNFIARRVDVSGCQDGVRMNANTVLEDSWIHNLRPTPDSHNDAVQGIGGGPIRIVGNALEARFRTQTAAVIIQSNVAPVESVWIEGNWLSGGAYSLYLRDASHGAPSDVTVSRNVWHDGSWRYGPVSVDPAPHTTWHGNVTSQGAVVPAVNDARTR